MISRYHTSSSAGNSISFPKIAVNPVNQDNKVKFQIGSEQLFSQDYQIFLQK